MPVIIVGTEKNFAALRPRLFAGKVSNAAVREVTDAIAAANPHVDLKKLEPGTVITVPDHPGVSTQGDLSLDDSAKELIQGIANAGADALEQLVGTARETESQAAQERKRAAAVLSSSEIDAAVRKDKSLAPDVKAAQEGLAQEDALAQDRQAALKDAQTQWNAELTALKGFLS
jgi:hypothetical protein